MQQRREEYTNFCETLYQTRNGAFFLVGDGMSEYTPYGAKLPGTNDTIRGHVLLPLDTAAAKKWLELRDKTDEYEQLFGQPDEAESNADYKSEYTITIRLPNFLAQRMRESLIKDESIQSFFQKSIEQMIANRKGGQ